MGFAGFAGQKYLNLETFKKNGQGVKTPVWFALDPAVNLDSLEARLFVYTIGVSGKIKRIRSNPKVRIAPCDMRGNVTGQWVAAQAEILAGDQARRGMGLLNRKYAPWKQLLDFFALFRALVTQQERIVFSLRPGFKEQT